ncbi:MAG: META domain-containing protein [Rhodanobacteraceae bacterium]
MANLDGTEWRFVDVAGIPVPAAVRATLRIRGHRISGRSGCNSFGAKYLVAPDGEGSFSQIMSTKMACVAPAGAMDVEHRIFGALPHVSKMVVRDGELVLLDVGGQPLARLEPAGGS